MLRQTARRRLATFFSLVSLMIFYATFLLKKHISIITKNPIKSREMDPIEEYSLPSLEDVMNSVVDLDFQRALLSYKNQYSQVCDHCYTSLKESSLPKEIPHVKVIIVSTWRSGSTFVGEILASHPGVYYHYEPLLSQGLIQFGPSSSKKDEIQLFLKKLLQCDYNGMEEYLQFNYGSPDSFVRNKRLWNICTSMPRFKCFKADILDKLCSLFPISVMKLVRIRLSLVAPLLSDPNVRIIFLTRDPRAVISSRTLNVKWCSEKTCKDPSVLCTSMLEDLNSYTTLKSEHPNQITILRYEDLITKPYNKTESVLEFLGLSMRQEVDEYLTQHVIPYGSDNSPWSTFRNPKQQMSKWLHETPWNSVVKTQYYCRPIMKQLGYRAFNSKEDYSSGNFVQHLNL